MRVHVGKFEMIHDVRKRPSVDVVLGPTYEQLVPEGPPPVPEPPTSSRRRRNDAEEEDALIDAQPRDG